MSDELIPCKKCGTVPYAVNDELCGWGVVYMLCDCGTFDCMFSLRPTHEGAARAWDAANTIGDLKPCPYCGESAHSTTADADFGGRWARVSCVNDECGVQPYFVVSEYDTAEKNLKLATARWNTRKESTS
jgi:hypothetical protein